MGYRVTKDQFIRLRQIEKQFGISAALEELRSGFVYGNWSCIVATPDKKDIEIKDMHWEFIPNFVNSMKDMELIRKGVDPKTGARKKPIPWLNAKAENLFTNEAGRKAMWADAARKWRCLIISNVFYEWRHFQPEGAKKPIAYPYMIQFHNHDYPLYMAGIYNTWTDRETGETIDTFAHVTTEANELMKEIHNLKERQPTILPEDLAYRWVLEDLTDEEITSIAKYQLPSEYFHVHTVARDFRETGCVDEVHYPELPPLEVAV